MKSPSKGLPAVQFVGGPLCGAMFDGRGSGKKLPRSIPLPHRGRLYGYRLHFRRKAGQTLFSYRFNGSVSEAIESDSVE
jgi:hypothetical protein